MLKTWLHLSGDLSRSIRFEDEPSKSRDDSDRFCESRRMPRLSNCTEKSGSLYQLFYFRYHAKEKRQSTRLREQKVPIRRSSQKLNIKGSPRISILQILLRIRRNMPFRDMIWGAGSPELTKQNGPLFNSDSQDKPLEEIELEDHIKQSPYRPADTPLKPSSPNFNDNDTVASETCVSTDCAPYSLTEIRNPSLEALKDCITCTDCRPRNLGDVVNSSGGEYEDCDNPAPPFLTGLEVVVPVPLTDKLIFCDIQKPKHCVARYLVIVDLFKRAIVKTASLRGHAHDIIYTLVCEGGRGISLRPQF